MVQGGTTNPTNSDEFIENVVKYISKREDLLEALESLLQANEFIKSGEIFNESTIKNVSERLIKDEGLFKGTMDILKEYLEKDNNQLKTLLEQVNKVEGMEKELETLGNQLLAQGLISGAAVTTLTGALAGLLTVGGVTGALIIGGAAFVGFVALFAIAAIGYLIYQNRGEIKEGAIKFGKTVKSFVKDVIDKLPTIQARENNFGKLISNLTEQGLRANGEERTILDNKVKIIEMLRNEEQRSAIRKLVKDGDIKEFSKKDMERLLQKGLSTHESDKEALEDSIEELKAAITSDSKTVEDFIQEVNNKAKGMKPSSKVKESNSEQVDGNNMKK
ncbi:phage tail tape measure protein [Wolbachia endosymbiont (group B) of Eucosma cana]|uniref:glycine zipper family protein n=1 Tax=Wolbachia endosymbiont (group B) of Eucosma cana TaxID=2954012 RepID=UPI002227640E|nr:glycine zipper family protein [Wolbachia endosymbiont (group B) of Eucosma cana]